MNALARSGKGGMQKLGTRLRGRLDWWERRDLILGRNAQAFCQRRDLRGAVSSFEGRVGAFSHQAWMQTLANQAGQALSGDAFSFRFDPVATALLADRIDDGCFRQIHNKPGSKTQIDVIARYQAFARVLLVEAGATREIIFF